MCALGIKSDPPAGQCKTLWWLNFAKHWAVGKMMSLASYVWWLNINADLEAKVKACEQCQSSWPPHAVYSSTPLMEWPLRPLSRLHLYYERPFNNMAKCFWSWWMLMPSRMEVLYKSTLLHPPSQSRHYKFVFTTRGSLKKIGMGNDL